MLDLAAGVQSQPPDQLALVQVMPVRRRVSLGHAISRTRGLKRQFGTVKDDSPPRPGIISRYIEFSFAL